ncbi:MAG: hypothetical protein AAFP70_00490 [Calditrichota bacterium]
MLRVFILFLLFSLSMSAQVAMLKKDIAKAEGSEKVFLLIDLAKTYVELSPDSAIHYAKMAHALSREERSGRDQIRSLQLLGHIYLGERNAEEALKYYTTAAAIIAQGKHMRFESAINRQLGNAHLALKQPENALEKYRKALISAKASDNKLEITRIGIQMGAMYVSTGDSTMALRYLKRSGKMAKELGSDSLIVAAALGQYNILDRRRQYGRALRAYKTFATTSAKIEKLDYGNKIMQMRIEHADAQDLLHGQLLVLTREMTEQNSLNRRVLIGMLISIVLLSLVCTFLYQSRKNLLLTPQKVKVSIADEEQESQDSTNPDLSAAQETLVRSQAVERLRSEHSSSR